MNLTNCKETQIITLHPSMMVVSHKVLWIEPNKKRTSKWMRRTRVQFPVGLNQTGLIGKIIPQKESFVNSSIRENVANDTKKFSLKTPVEETKDLIAMHNISKANLERTLELGGFPMPSIAITKKDIGHTNFGDISVLFCKDSTCSSY